MYFTTHLIHALDVNQRRCYNRKEAASYVGISAGSFDKLVRQRILPPPIEFLGRKVWDRDALDRAIDHLSGLTTGTHEAATEWDRLYQ